jgi:hypothetical protein
MCQQLLAATAIWVAFLLSPPMVNGCSAAKVQGVLTALPYQLDDRLVHVRVRVNGIALWFDVDTGARHSVIDGAAAKRLHLVLLRSDQMAGAGHETATMQHAAPVVISTGGVKLRVGDPWILDLSHVGTNRHIDGLLGADFFEAYVICIDPVTQTIAFYDPATFQYTGGGARVPLESQNNRLYISMKLSLANGISAIRMVRIDTGSDDAVSDNLVRQSPTRRRSVQGVGLGHPYTDYSGVFASVQVGPYHIHNVWGPSNDEPAVGMEILRRFKLTFDVGHGWLYLQPTSHLEDPVPSPVPLSS